MFNIVPCFFLGRRQAVRHRVLIPASVGSNPTASGLSQYEPPRGERWVTLIILEIIIGVQLSLVERPAWDGKAAGSNPATPTIWCYSVMANTSDFLSEKFGFESQQHHHLISASGRVGGLQRTVNPSPMDQQVRILPCRPVIPSSLCLRLFGSVHYFY